MGWQPEDRSVNSTNLADIMFESLLVKCLGYGVFWSSDSRQRFRARARQEIRGAKRFLYSSTIIPVPKSQGVRLVERRISLLGIPFSVRRQQRPKYKIALLVDEFFGGWDTAIGGYGALARKYICRHIPNHEIQIDLLLDAHGGQKTQKKLIDQTLVYRLPGAPAERQKWLDEQAYNLFLTIEMTEPSFKILCDYASAVPLLYWIQDPRELKMYQARARTVNRLRDDDWSYLKPVAVWMREMMGRKRVTFISQGESLSALARDLYDLSASVPVQDLANPVEIDFDYRLNDPPKKNKIIFLGRLEAQKRVWMVCEIAKAMPQYEFYILGATGKGRDEAANAKTLEPYRNPDGSSKLKNLHFTGHVDGAVKAGHIREAKLVLNTSIWEGIPVSWLEALSYGTLIVSAFDRDNIVERFGTFVGEVMGDGTGDADIKKFAGAIEHWMAQDAERIATAQKAIKFIRERHSVPTFVNNMRAAILDAIP